MNADERSPLLADEDWRRLATIVALPDAARSDFEKIMRLGKDLAEHETTAPAPSETKKSLRAMRRKAEALHADLRRMSEDVFGALIFPPESSEEISWGLYGPTRLGGYRSLVARIENVAQLVDWLKAAEAHTPEGKSGDRTWAAHVVTSEIDVLLRKHNAGAKSGGLTPEFGPGAEFLDACFELIGITVTAAAMIKRMAAKRNGKVSAESNRELCRDRRTPQS
jgi:hypothetical protein